MKKYLLILLLFTGFLQAQTLQNPTFGNTTTNTLKLKTNTEASTSTKLSTQEADGSINFIQPINVPIPYTPSNYTISNQSIGQHLTGIDTRLGQISSTTAGITQRVYFTADNTTVTAGTFFTSSLTGKGSTATGSPPALVLADNTKGYFTKDVISVAFTAATIGYAGSYTGQLTVSATPTPVATQQRFTVEIYRTNNGGTPIASGVSGAPTGDLGVTVVAILDSGILNLTAGSITNIPITGILTQNITLNTGERLRYHVSAAKIGAGGGNVTFGVYYGSSYNSYYDIPVAITTDAVLNKSGVAGVTATDALNTLNTNRITGSFISGRIPYSNSTSNLTDSSRLLWDNTNSILNVNGNKPVISLKENLNNKTIDITTTGPGSNILIIQQNGGKKRLTLEGEDASGFGEARLGIGNFTGGIPTESQVFVYGGNTGANIDARGSNSVDEANIDLEGSDWTTNINSLGLSYFGPNRTGLTPIYGYAKNKLGQVRFQNASTALITSINETSTITPIRFGINTSEIANINDKGFSYQSDFSSVNSSNPRWFTDKGYVDSGLATKQNILTNPITGTGSIGYIPVFSGTSVLSSSMISQSSGVVALSSSLDQVPFNIQTTVVADEASIGFKSLNSANTFNVRIGGKGNDLVFFTNNTLRGSFLSTGEFRVYNLSGIGTRTVVTDANGNLSATDTPPSRPYKVYTALLTQSGTSAPTATVLENTLGGTVVWTRSGVGSYLATLTGAFVLNKTSFSATVNGTPIPPSTSSVNIYGNRATADTIAVSTVTNTGFADGTISPAYIEIRVYN